jgi:hypothetical protein
LAAPDAKFLIATEAMHILLLSVFCCQRGRKRQFNKFMQEKIASTACSGTALFLSPFLHLILTPKITK